MSLPASIFFQQPASGLAIPPVTTNLWTRPKCIVSGGSRWLDPATTIQTFNNGVPSTSGFRTTAPGTWRTAPSALGMLALGTGVIVIRCSTPTISLLGGTTYTFSCFIKQDASYGVLACSLTGLTSSASQQSVAANPNWQRVWCIVTPSVNSTPLLVFATSTVTPNPNAPLYIDNIQVEVSSGPSDYCDGSLGEAYSWSGTPWNSTSSRNAPAVSQNAVTSASQDLVVFGDLTVTGTLHSNLHLPFVNVMDYGAQGNGIDDDTAAIANAITAAAGSRGVFFPAGTYTSTAQILATNVWLIGEAFGAVILKYTGSSLPNLSSFLGSGSGTTISGTLSGGTITSPAVTAGGSGWPGTSVQVWFYGAAGTPATGTATVVGGVVQNNIVLTFVGSGLTNPITGYVTATGITNGGSTTLFSNAGQAAFIVLHGNSDSCGMRNIWVVGTGGGSGGSVTGATQAAGAINFAGNIAAAGVNYTAATRIWYTGSGGGSGAWSTPTLNATGGITGLTLQAAGSGYSGTITATVDPMGSRPLIPSGVCAQGSPLFEDCEFSGWDAGLIYDSLGGHWMVRRTRSIANYYGMYIVAENGDSTVAESDLTNSAMASFAWHSNCISSLFLQRIHLGGGVYGMYQEFNSAAAPVATQAQVAAARTGTPWFSDLRTEDVHFEGTAAAGMYSECAAIDLYGGVPILNGVQSGVYTKAPGPSSGGATQFVVLRDLGHSLFQGAPGRGTYGRPFDYACVLGPSINLIYEGAWAAQPLGTFWIASLVGGCVFRTLSRLLQDTIVVGDGLNPAFIHMMQQQENCQIASGTFALGAANPSTVVVPFISGVSLGSFLTTAGTPAALNNASPAFGISVGTPPASTAQNTSNLLPQVTAAGNGSMTVAWNLYVSAISSTGAVYSGTTSSTIVQTSPGTMSVSVTIQWTGGPATLPAAMPFYVMIR